MHGYEENYLENTTNETQYATVQIYFKEPSMTAITLDSWSILCLYVDCFTLTSNW